MKRKRFSVEQIVAVVKQAELGLPVADLIRQVGISEQTFYRWKREYGGCAYGSGHSTLITCGPMISWPTALSMEDHSKCLR
jgi:hypothetical protein